MNDTFDPVAQDKSPEDLLNELRDAMRFLDWTPVELMDQMRELGDYRSPAAILKGINRALSGEIKVSGELLTVVKQMVRLKRRLLRTYGGVLWHPIENGSYTSKIEDFQITLCPQSKGRWLVNTIHKNGYSHKFPRWQTSLDAAKSMALFTLDNAQNWMQETAEEIQKNSS